MKRLPLSEIKQPKRCHEKTALFFIILKYNRQRKTASVLKSVVLLVLGRTGINQIGNPAIGLNKNQVHLPVSSRPGQRGLSHISSERLCSRFRHPVAAEAIDCMVYRDENASYVYHRAICRHVHILCRRHQHVKEIYRFYRILSTYQKISLLAINVGFPSRILRVRFLTTASLLFEVHYQNAKSFCSIEITSSWSSDPIVPSRLISRSLSIVRS